MVCVERIEIMRKILSGFLSLVLLITSNYAGIEVLKDTVTSESLVSEQKEVLVEEDYIEEETPYVR